MNKTPELTVKKTSQLLVANNTKAKNSTFFTNFKTIILLTIFAIKEVVFVHKFFLRTLFRSSISDVPPPIKLKVGYRNKLQFKMILLIRYLLKDQFWGQQWYKGVHNSILQNLKQQNLDPNQLKMPIPTVKLEEISPEEFWQKYVKTCTPVIIKGGAKHTSAYQNWTPEMFGDRLGEIDVRILDNNEPVIGKLKEVIDSKGTERQLYLSFCSNIFSSHPELSDELGHLDFRKYLGGNSTRFIGAQLFLGVHRATGTGAHCAGGYNLFFQIAGKKKWTFVHPDYLWLMYPMLDRDFNFCASFLKKDYDEQYLNRYAPLQQYCPKYEAVLEPGDILLNPPWLWHAINNLTDETIAVATRWVPLGIKRSNTFFDLMQLLSPKAWQNRFYALSRNSDDSSVLERNTNFLVKKHQDFVKLSQNDPKATLEFDQWSQNDQFSPF
jgi:hypothetical protein